MTNVSTDTLNLVVLSGPEKLAPIDIQSGERRVLGRSSSCEVTLDDPNASISRRHIEIGQSEDGWVAIDLGSRNGSLLNGIRMLPDFPSAITHGDTIQIGSWTFRVLTDDSEIPDEESINATIIHTMSDSDHDELFVERVEAAPLATLASHRLAVLLECADEIYQVDSVLEAARIALNAMIASTGFSRAAYLKPCSESGRYETIAFQSSNPFERIEDVNFSQSLLISAARGEIVRLSKTNEQVDLGQSIADLDIHSALCVPVLVGEDPIGFLYLDARGSESSVSHDASSFGRAVARLFGLTISNLRGKKLEIEQHAMQYDLDAAANAQRLLLPPGSGIVGDLSYSMLMRPGRLVAGDLFGIVELPDGRVCAFLGDVSGKGAGAAIMMATTQSYIHAMLEQHTDLGHIVSKLNRHIADRSTGQFVTMWIGLFTPDEDKEGAVVDFIDGGHGHWLVSDGTSAATRPQYNGGLVVGIDPEITYTSESFRLHRGQRIVFFSDGVVEQTSPTTDEEYGLERAGRLIQGCETHAEDVERLLEDVLAFAESDHLRDDTTIASVGLA